MFNCDVKIELECTVQPNLMLQKGSMRGFQSNVTIYSTDQNSFVAFIRFSMCLPYVMALFQQRRACSVSAGKPPRKMTFGGPMHQRKGAAKMKLEKDYIVSVFIMCYCAFAQIQGDQKVSVLLIIVL